MPNFGCYLYRQISKPFECRPLIAHRLRPPNKSQITYLSFGDDRKCLVSVCIEYDVIQ